ncbi:MAG: aminopeptidase N, partial [bacterium]
ELKSIKVNGQKLTTDQYRLEEEKLILSLSDAEVLIEIVNIIHPDKNTALEGLYTSGDFLLTQCEAEGFRKISYFQDRPDVMARFTTTIVADKTQYPVLLSNGNLVESCDQEGGKHKVVWEDPFPKPCYLFALVAGELACIEGEHIRPDGRPVSLKFYAEKENINDCDYALESLKRSMEWDEERFGLVYDLDLYNVVATNDFNMGAMENKSLNIFNSKYVLASPETATDRDYQGIEAVIGHEYFHNWTGNRVTCKDWFQLSLKEGLTVYRDQEFTSDMQSRAVKRIEDVRALRSSQFAEDAGPMAHPIRPDKYIEINNFYTLTVYEKGAEVVRMYETLLGRAGFRKGMDLYFKRHDGQAVSCDDFRLAMADANNVNLDQFELWYAQSGTPVVKVEMDYSQQQSSFTLTMRQNTPPSHDQKDKKPLHIPVRMALLGHDGKALDVEINGQYKNEHLLELKQEQQIFVFSDVKEKPVPSLFRGFSAPVKIEQSLTDEELAFLMAEDEDSFVRWDSSQSLAIRILLSDGAQRERSEQIYISSLQKMLEQNDLDPSLIAETMRLPEESYLAELVSEVDPQKIHNSRNTLKQKIALQLKDQLKALYDTHTIVGDYHPEASDIGHRSLKNVCLTYLVLLEEHQNLALIQYDHSNNMTDAQIALTLLTHERIEGYEQRLEAFYNQWESHALMMDKWFMIQASSSQTTPDDLYKLMENKNFSLNNPNKVRSVLGVFARMNPVQFHREDGQGYKLLVEMVVKLNAINPQITSRLVSNFNNWKKLEPLRKALMKKALIEISEHKDLSPDVYEIVSKALV